MIRSATISDSEPIANALWSIWRQFKIRQIPSAMHSYTSSEALGLEITRDLSRWLVCELPESKPTGFFSLCPIGDEKTCKRWRFPKHSVRIEYFACLLPGEILLQQLQLLASHLPHQSILLVIPSSLRDALWAATKTGFLEFGDGSQTVGGFAWLYLDRENRHEEIETKLRRAKVIL